MNFSAKVAKSCSIREKARKIIDLAKTLQLFEETTMSLHFDKLFRKKLQKVPYSVKKHEKWSIWPKLCNFSNKKPCLWISMNFSEKSCKKCLISWKSTTNHRFRQNLQLFEKTTMFLRFDELYNRNLQKVPHFVKKHENSSIWPKLCNFFEQTTMFWCFDELFSKRLQKVAQFVKKHERSSIWPKLCNFSRKLPCLCISINFSGKSCKKCLIPWKSTKNDRSGQKFATFLTKNHVFAFRWTFQKKVAKSASFPEKARQIIDFAKTCNFSKKLPCFYVSMNFIAETCKKFLISWKSTKTHRFDQNYATFSNKLPCFGVSMNFSAKGCKKLLNSWKSTKSHPFGQNFAIFPTNYLVFSFRWTFQEKVAKSASFREQARKTIDLARTFNFSSKLPCYFWHFHELFSKKLQKVPHLVKKHEKSSIWQTLSNFFNKLPCFCILMNF